VAHEQHRPSFALPYVAHLAQALVLERLVADGEHLVHEQDVGIDVDRDREAQPDVHAGRVVLHRLIDEFGQLGELDDRLHRRIGLQPAEPEQ